MYNSSIFLMLREYKLLQSLSEKEIEQLSAVATIAHFDKNSFIYEVGDTSKYVYLVQKGSVKLGITASCGKILIKDIAYEHALFGENVFLNSDDRKEYAKTMKDTTIIKIPVNDFRSLVSENAEFAAEVMGVVIHRLKLLEERMQAFVFKKAKKRIVDFIKNTGRLRGIKIGIDEILINHGMSHKEIAYLTDTSRQTVARVLGELKRDELIHFSARKPNKILIRNTMLLS